MGTNCESTEDISKDTIERKVDGRKVGGEEGNERRRGWFASVFFFFLLSFFHCFFSPLLPFIHSVDFTLVAIEFFFRQFLPHSSVFYSFTFNWTHFFLSFYFSSSPVFPPYNLYFDYLLFNSFFGFIFNLRFYC